MPFSFRPDRSNRPATQQRLARPGVVYGGYPQRDETRHGKPQRRAGVIKAHLVPQIAAQVGAPSVAQVRRALMDQALDTQTCALALRLVADLVDAELDMRVRACQYEAAANLLNQRLAEMDTGEGKSVAIALAAAVAALTGTPVHVMTTNDYLAGRDAHTFETVFRRLGLSVSTITATEQSPASRCHKYAADICYGTAKAIAFDYLRDQRLLVGKPQSSLRQTATTMRGLCMAIVDEADSILLDEATMPLVLAEQTDDPQRRARLWQAIDLARQLQSGTDFQISELSRRIDLSTNGTDRIADLGASYSEEWLNSQYRHQLVVEALNALYLFEQDRDYIIRDEQILVVDQNTGRAVPGRQFPGQLHGLIAVRHGLAPAPATRAASGLTYPRFFARYHHLCGLSGTLMESKRELKALYGLQVRRIARHQPNRLLRMPLRVMPNRRTQIKAAVRRAIDLASIGRPVLIGTDSVAESEVLARYLRRAGAAATVLNAGNDTTESERIANAGISGQITISTQIAGRGTDIVPDHDALAAGGLHVLNLQHNRNARIDRQMSGRAARQGNPGSCEHWIRTTDSAFSSDRLPRPVRRAFALCCRFGASAIGLQVVRIFWRAEDRLARATRLRADRELSSRLHFSSMSNQ